MSNLWTKEEISRLRQGVRKYGNSWSKIKSEFNLNRSVHGISHKGRSLCLKEIELYRANESNEDSNEDEPGRNFEEESDSSFGCIEEEGKRFQRIMAQESIKPQFSSTGKTEEDNWGIAKVLVYCDVGVTVKKLLRTCHYYKSQFEEEEKPAQLCICFPESLARRIVNILLPFVKKVLSLQNKFVEIAVVCHTKYEYACVPDYFLVKKTHFTSSSTVLEQFFKDLMACTNNQPRAPFAENYCSYELGLLESGFLPWRSEAHQRHFLCILDVLEGAGNEKFFRIDSLRCLRMLKAKNVKVSVFAPVDCQEQTILQCFEVNKKQIREYSHVGEIDNFVESVWKEIQFVHSSLTSNNTFMRILQTNKDESGAPPPPPPEPPIPMAPLAPMPAIQDNQLPPPSTKVVEMQPVESKLFEVTDLRGGEMEILAVNEELMSPAPPIPIPIGDKDKEEEDHGETHQKCGTSVGSRETEMWEEMNKSALDEEVSTLISASRHSSSPVVPPHLRNSNNNNVQYDNKESRVIHVTIPQRGSWDYERMEMPIEYSKRGKRKQQSQEDEHDDDDDDETIDGSVLLDSDDDETVEGSLGLGDDDDGAPPPPQLQLQSEVETSVSGSSSSNLCCSKCNVYTCKGTKVKLLKKFAKHQISCEAPPVTLESRIKCVCGDDIVPEVFKASSGKFHKNNDKYVFFVRCIACRIIREKGFKSYLVVSEHCTEFRPLLLLNEPGKVQSTLPVVEKPAQILEPETEKNLTQEVKEEEEVEPVIVQMKFTQEVEEEAEPEIVSVKMKFTQEVEEEEAEPEIEQLQEIPKSPTIAEKPRVVESEMSTEVTREEEPEEEVTTFEMEKSFQQEIPKKMISSELGFGEEDETVVLGKRKRDKDDDGTKKENEKELTLEKTESMAIEEEEEEEVVHFPKKRRKKGEYFCLV